VNHSEAVVLITENRGESLALQRGEDVNCVYDRTLKYFPSIYHIMSVQTDKLEQLGSDLGEAIAETPEYETFEETKAAVEADDEVQAQIAKFQDHRDTFMTARQAGTATQEMLDKVKSAQSELHNMSKMAAYLDAQKALQSKLEDINKAISDPLAVDFGGEAGGCCQDE